MDHPGAVHRLVDDLDGRGPARRRRAGRSGRRPSPRHGVAKPGCIARPGEPRAGVPAADGSVRRARRRARCGARSRRDRVGPSRLGRGVPRARRSPGDPPQDYDRMADRWLRGVRPDGVPVGRRRAAGVARVRRRADAARHPRRAGVHAARRCAAAATRATSSPASRRCSSTPAGRSSSCSPTSRTRPPTRSTRRIGYEPVNDVDEYDFG